MRYRWVLLSFVVAIATVGLGGVSASAQPATIADAGADRSGETSKAQRKGRKPSCRRYCAQAGGFGADCEEQIEEECNDVYVPRQTLDGTRDQVVSIRATCKLEVDCVGAIILSTFRKGEYFEYGRADLEIPAGQTAKVKVGISKKSLEFLKKDGKDRKAFTTIPLDLEPDTVSVSIEGITVLPPG